MRKPMVFRPARRTQGTQVTYGGAVRRAFREVSRVGATNVGKLAGDWRPLAMHIGCYLWYISI